MQARDVEKDKACKLQFEPRTSCIEDVLGIINVGSLELELLNVSGTVLFIDIFMCYNLLSQD